MRRLILIIIVGAVYFVVSPICFADDLVQDFPSSQTHNQIVNQDLDRIEYSENTRAVLVAVPVTTNGIPTASAETSVVPPTSISPIVTKTLITRKRDEIEFGPDFYWARYQQPGVYHQRGFMAGYNASFTYRTASPTPFLNKFRIEGQWDSGKFNDPTDGFNGIRDTSYEVRGLLGHEFYPLSSIRATGYSGFGYRFFEDNPDGLSGSDGEFTVLGYKTYAHYCYIPFGLDLLYQSSPKYSLDSDFEFDWMVRGWEDSFLGVLQEGYGTTVNHQDGGFGVRLSLKLKLYFKYCDAFAETYFRYWNIAQSNNLTDPVDPTNPPLYIPKNNTEELGFRLGLAI